MNDNLKLIIIAHDLPYPPNHGGRVDMWNRIIAFSRFGVHIHLVTWSDQEILPEQIDFINRFVKSVFIYIRNRNPLLALHPKYPSTVISRKINDKQYNQLINYLKQVEPDIVFLDGIHGAISAVNIANNLKIPIIYRSHNVEHKYVRGLVEAENNIFKKLFLWTKIHRTFMTECMVRRKANQIYDISKRDAEIWHDIEDMVPSKVLSPYLMLDDNSNEKPKSSEQDIDILYIGNMNMSNNVYGLKWFIKYIAPLLKEMKIVLAGSNPVDEIRLLCRTNSLQLIPNPPEVQSLYERARVLINPIWHGSGVNIKMIEMLATGKPVISTTIGASGLTTELKKYALIADKPKEFAKSIQNQLASGISQSQRAAVIQNHSWTNVKQLINELESIIRSKEK